VRVQIKFEGERKNSSDWKLILDI